MRRGPHHGMLAWRFAGAAGRAGHRDAVMYKLLRPQIETYLVECTISRV